MENNLTEYISKYLNDLFKLLNLNCEYSINEKDDITSVILSSNEPELLIGFHGNTINSIEKIVRLAVYNKFNEWKNVRVDINNYKIDKEEKIRQIARKAADKCKFTNGPIYLLPMNSYDRKVVHEEIAGIEGLQSYSEGEKNDRRVVIDIKA